MELQVGGGAAGAAGAAGGAGGGEGDPFRRMV